MTIDLRWLLPVVAFYAPGAMMLVGAWGLGFTTEEVRGFVGFAGGGTGLIAAILIAADAVNGNIRPLRVRLWGRGDNPADSQ